MFEMRQEPVRRWAIIGDTPGDFTFDECAETLERIPFFSRLRPDDRRDLEASGVIRAYRSGAHIMWEGQEPAMGLFAVIRGRVRITRLSEHGAEQELATLDRGEIFGEMGLLDDRPRSATATAIEPTLAFIVPAVEFRAALRRNGEAAGWLLTLLARRVRRAEGGPP